MLFGIVLLMISSLVANSITMMVYLVFLGLIDPGLLEWGFWGSLALALGATAPATGTASLTVSALGHWRPHMRLTRLRIHAVVGAITPVLFLLVDMPQSMWASLGRVPWPLVSIAVGLASAILVTASFSFHERFNRHRFLRKR